MRILGLLPMGILAGCAFLPTPFRQALPLTQEGIRQAVPPGAGLHGRAALLQDSLRSRLEWFTSAVSKDGPLVGRVAFEGPDSALRIEVRFDDANGWNSHGRSRAEVACLEAARWKRLETGMGRLRQESGLDAWPLQGTLAFRSHDLQRGRTDWAWDTLAFVATDSLRWSLAGNRLGCRRP